MILSVAQFVTALDYSIVYIALPSISVDLHMRVAVAQWVISSYAVLFAGFLVAGGRLADRVGPRRLFFGAVLAFGAMSAAGAIAPDATVLLAARGGQGLAAALLQPAVLGLIGRTFPAGPARGRALAVWGSVGAAGLASGAILGGVLTAVSWRFTFLVNVPLALGCAAGALRWIHGDTRRSSRIPLLAAFLATGTVLALSIGLTLCTRTIAWALGFLVLAGIAGVAFVRNEMHSRAALIEPAVRGIASLRLGAVAAALCMASVGSEFYLLTLLLQAGRAYSPIRAGLAFLPLAIMVTAGSGMAGRLVGCVGSKALLAAGFGISAIGLLWLSVSLTGSYSTDLLPGIVLSGFGHGIIFTSTYILGTHDVPPEQHGLSGALLTTAQYLSGALTIAVLTVVLGQSPDNSRFRAAFLVISGAAVLGVGLTRYSIRGRIRIIQASDN